MDIKMLLTIFTMESLLIVICDATDGQFFPLFPSSALIRKLIFELISDALSMSRKAHHYYWKLNSCNTMVT